MLESWMTATECADWWNGLLNQHVEKVQNWSESKGYGADTMIGFCLFWHTNCLQSATDLLLIDNLRLGQGAGNAWAGGSKWGYLADLGRLTAFIPLARIPGAVGRLVKGGSKAEQGVLKNVEAIGKMDQAGAKLAASSEHLAMSGKEYLVQVFRLKDPASKHGVCWAVAMAQALRHTGRYWVRLEDIAKLLNISRGARMFDSLERISITALRQLKILLDEMKINCVYQELAAFRKMGYKTMDMLHAVTNNQRGVLLFGVRWVMDGVGEVGHVLYAFRDAQGVLKIADRSGEVVSSFAALEKIYPGISKASMQTVDAAIFIYEAAIPQATKEGLRNLGCLGNLMIPVVLTPAVLGVKNQAAKANHL
jgi:hypothetical protein